MSPAPASGMPGPRASSPPGWLPAISRGPAGEARREEQDRRRRPWPRPARCAPGGGCLRAARGGRRWRSADRVRRGRRVAPVAPRAPRRRPGSRASRASARGAHRAPPRSAGRSGRPVRHRLRCVSRRRRVEGWTAMQRCSRSGRVARQAAPGTSRYGARRPCRWSDAGRARPRRGRCVRQRRIERDLIAGARSRARGIDQRRGSCTAAASAAPSRARPTTAPAHRGRASLRRSAADAKNPGDDLFSRKAALSVSSALESLTAVFGMGTGVASPLESPGFFCCDDVTRRRRDGALMASVRRTSRRWIFDLCRDTGHATGTTTVGSTDPCSCHWVSC